MLFYQDIDLKTECGFSPTDIFSESTNAGRALMTRNHFHLHAMGCNVYKVWKAKIYESLLRGNKKRTICDRFICQLFYLHMTTELKQ
jgi:hypothetical protein